MNQFEYQPQIKLFKGYLPTKPVASGHSSVDTSAPTLLRPQVRIPCTPSTLFQFIVELCEQAQIFFLNLSQGSFARRVVVAEISFRP